MTATVEWGDPIPHDGSDKCPDHARDVLCAIRWAGVWFGNDKHSTPSIGKWLDWGGVSGYRLPADHPFYAKGQQPAEEPTCGGCRWLDRYDSDFALPGQGRCHFNPATPDGFGLCFEDSMACSKFTAKGAGQ